MYGRGLAVAHTFASQQDHGVSDRSVLLSRRGGCSIARDQHRKPALNRIAIFGAGCLGGSLLPWIEDSTIGLFTEGFCRMTLA